MAENYSIGTAYLSVMPKVDAKFKSELQSAGSTGGKAAGEAIQGGISAKTVAIGNLIANAITAGAQAGAEALTSIIEEALQGFAQFEQLSGGVDKIFGDSAQQVLRDAQQAWATAGMSANEYMQNVTGFSSSLIASLGGDTDEAARIANMALVDMADNVNTFGSDMESVTRAYQGFAKQNYMMLDNLKLGYGGTRSEMQRLLEDAEALTGVHYDIENLADVYNAIHEIQVSLQITGKTSEEAFSTVEGSVKALQSAWSNWLTELGKADADMDAVTDALVTALSAAASNVIPALQRIAANLAKEFPAALAKASQELFGDTFTPLIEAFGRVQEFGGQVAEVVGQAWEALAPLMQPLFDLLAQIADVMANQIIPLIAEIAGSEIVAFIGSVIIGIGGIIAGIGQLVALASEAVAQVAGFFEGLYAGLVSGFENARIALEGIGNGIVEFFAGIPDRIVGFFSDIGERIVGFFRGLSFPTLHLSGSLNPLEWGSNPPRIEWYACGGIIDNARLIGVGEAGAEAVVPLTPGRLQPFGEAVADAMGGRGATNVYINGARVNDDESVEALFYAFMQELARLGVMGGGARLGYA